jgi:hypothetical protein
VSSGGEVVAPELGLAIFVCSCFIYICSMGISIYHHSRRMWRIIRAKDLTTVGRFQVPAYLASWQGIVGLARVCFLLIKFAPKPVPHCIYSGGELVE